jgi:predicted RNase H-like HicB family nuclease
MQIPVLLEPVAGNGFRARSGEPVPISAEGSTREEALRNLQRLLENMVRHGAEIAALEIPSRSHPLAPFAGMLADDPLFDEWIQAMREYREKAESDPTP